MFRFKSITTKLLITFLTIGIAPVFLIGFLSIKSAESALYREVSEGLLRFVESKEGQVFAYLYSIETRAIDFSSDGFIRNNFKNIINEIDEEENKISLTEHLIKNKKSLDNSIVGISISDLNGEILVATSEGETGRNEGKHEHFNEIVNEGRSVSIKSGLMMHDHFGLFNAFIVSVPLKDNINQETIGVLNVVFSTDLMHDIMSGNFQLQRGALTGTEGITDGFEAYIVNKEKTMFVHPHKLDNEGHSSHYHQMEVNTFPVQACLDRSEEIVTRYGNYGGVEVIGASMCITDRGWTVIAEIETGKAFSNIQEIYQEIILTLIIFFLTIAGVSLLIASKIENSFNELTLGAKKITDGNLDAKINIRSIDEFGSLAKAFNKMAMSLKKARTNIEKKVDKRTEELSKMNKYMVGRELKMMELKEKIKKSKNKNNKK